MTPRRALAKLLGVSIATSVRLIAVMTTLLLFVLSLGLALVLHLGLPVAKRAGADITEKLLSSTLQGNIEIGEISRLGRGGVTARDITVLDPSGRTVLTIEELSSDVDLAVILDRVFGNYEKLSIQIDSVSVKGSEIFLLRTDEISADGVQLTHPSIQDAFMPVPSEKKATTSKGRPVRVWFPKIDLRRVYVRGTVAGSPVIEAKVDQTSARLLATEKGASIDINQFMLSASGLGGVDTIAAGEVHIRAPGAVWGRVDGRVGEVPTRQDFRFENGAITLDGSFPRLMAKELRPLFGTWPLDRPIAIENHLSGTPPHLKFSAKVVPENATTPDADTSVSGDSDNDSDSAKKLDSPLFLEGTLNLEPTLNVQVHATSKKLNLNQFHSTLPESSLDSTSTILVRQTKTSQAGAADSQIEVRVTTSIEPGTVAGHLAPKVRAEASYTPAEWALEAELEEKSLSAHVTAGQKSGEKLLFSVRAESESLSENQHLLQLGIPLAGSAGVKANGSLDGDNFDVRAEAWGGGLRISDVAVSHLGVKAEAHGNLQKLDDTEGRVELKLARVNRGSIVATDVGLTASGNVRDQRVTLSGMTQRGLALKAEANVHESGARFTQISATLSGDGEPVEATAKSIQVKSSHVKIEELSLKSLGEVHGDVDFGPNGGTVDLTATQLSVSRLADTLGLARAEFGGHLNGSVKLEVGARTAGRIDVEVKDGALQGMTGIALSAHAGIDGTHTSGEFRTSIEGLGQIISSWTGELAGSVLEESSYRRAVGRFELELKDLDLRTASLLLGQPEGMSDLSGSLNASVIAERRKADSVPVVEVTAETQALALTLTGQTPTRIRGLDLNWAASFGDGGSQLGTALRISDARGLLASVSGSIELPLYSWVLGEQVIDQSTLRSAPIELVAILPKREIKHWPAFVPRPVESGQVVLRASVTGTLDSPEVVFSASGTGLDGEGSHFREPIDLIANGRYIAQSGVLRGNFVVERKAHRIGSADLDVLFPYAQFVTPSESKQSIWTGEVRVLLESTPLDVLTELDSRKVSGYAQGGISILRTSEATHLEADLNMRGLSANGYRLGDAHLEARTHQKDLVVRAKFNDEYGSLLATAELGTVQTPLLLTIADDQSVFVSLESERYDAAVLAPFLAGVLDEISGPLNGKLRAQWTPPDKGHPEGQTSFSGKMELREGVITPSALGLRLTDASLSVTATPQGSLNVVKVTEISAMARSKTKNVHGGAELVFDSLNLLRGSFHLSPTKVPILADGAELAEVTGSTRGTFELTDEEIRIDVEIDKLTAELPESSESDLIELTENESIDVLQHVESDHEKTDPQKGGTPLLISVNLGEDLRIKSSILNLRVRGKPEIRFAEQMSLGGYVELIPGGRVEVLGRGFVIERGIVMFDTGDVANPHLDATASWTAPNGVIVRATLGGTAKNLTLRWSSDPALPGGEPEIIALVLGSGSSGSSMSTSVAIAANEALGKTGLRGVEIYANQQGGTSDGRIAEGAADDATWDSYTAAIRLSEDIWFEGSVQTNVPGPQNATSAGISGTIDWRFHPQWSARTEIGNIGAGINLVWKYRY